MPTSTACRAIRLDLRAMRIASARASSRSTVSTTSAASDEAVAPRARPRQRRPRRGERRGVVHAVAHHDRGTVLALEFDRRELVRRVALRKHGIDPDDPPHRVRDVRPVAGDQNDPVDPHVAERANHPRRIRPNRVFEEEGTRGLAVDRDEDGQRPIQVRAACAPGAPKRAACRRRSMRPCPPAPRGTRSCRSSRTRAPLARLRASRAAVLAAWRAVTIELASTCGETWSREAASRSISSASMWSPAVTTSRQGGPPLGQGAGLVEEHHAPGGQPFERSAALDDDADVRGPRQSGHDGDRGRQEQRARGGHDQHGDRRERGLR